MCWCRMQSLYSFKLIKSWKCSMKSEIPYGDIMSNLSDKQYTEREEQ